MAQAEDHAHVNDALPDGQAVVSNAYVTARALPFNAQDYRDEIARMRRSRRHKIVAVILILLVIVGAAVAVQMFLKPLSTVPDSAMSPTLEQGQLVVVNRNAAPQTGVVMAYRGYGGEARVGRVVAEPGDWVAVANDGRVAVSKTPLDANSIKEALGSDVGTASPFQMPADSYYLLGDAQDATVNGLMSGTDIIKTDQFDGQVVFRLWPIFAIGPVS